MSTVASLNAKKAVKSNGEKIDAIFNSFSGGVSGTPVSEGKREVIEISGLTSASDLAQELIDQLSFRNDACAIKLDVAKVAEAFDALVYLRICQVNGKRATSVQDLAPRDCRYPAFLRPVLAGIGKVEDEENQIFIDIKPGKSLERFSKLKDDDWVQIANLLRTLCNYGRQLGMETCPSLPYDKTGSVQVLSIMIDKEEHLASATKVTPAHLLIRSALGLSELVTLFGTARFTYNSVSYYKRQFKDFVGLSFQTA